MNQPIALTIAGSDCSAGAGMQADLKTFSALGVHGFTAVTCVVSETPLTVNCVHPVPPEVLHDQIRLLLESYPVNAIKTGMLYSKEHILTVCNLLEGSGIPLIVDPVMVASTGDPLLVEDALEAIAQRLLPLATIITPNLPEAGLLLGRSVRTPEEQEVAAQELAAKYGTICYLKGGHSPGEGDHRDLLVGDGEASSFSAPHLDLAQTHGTGCTLAAALSAGIAKGLPIKEAAKHAHQFTHQALKNSLTWSIPGSTQTISHLDQTQHHRDDAP
ncbi:bifunctional hydroxymethylpyrimidine kinase/phosphomethylpyrimidine kinase [Verrucomicrobiaceae bacterium 227]